jgi:hypothetical protein
MIIGAVIGLLGSIIPEAVKLFKTRQDNKHEKEMLELQMQYQREMADIRIQEARALATLEIDKQTYSFANTEIKPTGSLWIDMFQVVGSFYNQTVRPTLTYLVIMCWLMVKYALWQTAGGTLGALTQIWTSADDEFVSAVVMFWFGGRAFSRTFNRVK